MWTTPSRMNMLHLLPRRAAAAARWPRSPLRCVHSAAVDDEDKYLELRQLRDIKSEEFYDAQGEKRRYFYYIDLQGRLFLENTRPKNIATSLKSAKFLKFFFSQVQPNVDAKGDPELEPLLEYPFKSPCGKEMNFIKCADRPFVLDSLAQDPESGKWTFTFGGGALTMPFHPDTLRVSLSTGRLYHAIRTRHVLPGTEEGTALIRSQLAVEIAKHMELHEDFGSNGSSDGAIIGDFEWDNARYPIRAMD